MCVFKLKGFVLQPDAVTMHLNVEDLPDESMLYTMKPIIDRPNQL